MGVGIGKKRVNPGAQAERVLIIKLSALGDFFLALGAMKAVREHHRSAQITLLTTPPYQDFAKITPYIDVVETDGRPENFSLTHKLIQRIRRAKYDIIYDFQTSERTANYFKLLNLSSFKTPLWSGHAKHSAFEHNNPNRAHMHTIDRLGEQLSYAGLGPKGGYTAKTVPMPDLSWVRRVLKNPPRLQPQYYDITPPYALITAGASAHRQAKIWPIEHYIEIIKRISEAGITPVLIGGKAESKMAAQIQKSDPHIINLVNRTDFTQIIALAEGAEFVLGNDTGPTHIATLAGAPGVVLFATQESQPSQAAPRGPNPVIIVHSDRLDEVYPGDVWQAIQSLKA